MTIRAPLSVLVVDDEQRSQETLRRTLEEDFTVFTAASAEEGIAVMEREFVHIVLSDQRMPGTSGVDLSRLAGMVVPPTDTAFVKSRVLTSGTTRR